MSHVILKTPLSQPQLVQAFSKTPPEQMRALWQAPSRSVFLVESTLAPGFYLEIQLQPSDQLKLSIHATDEMPRAKTIAPALNGLTRWIQSLDPSCHIQAHTLGRYADFN